MLARAAAERIEIGDEVAELAVRVHQLRHRAARACAVAQREIEAGEHEGPALVDGSGIAEVFAIEGIDVVGIGAGDLVEGKHASAVPDSAYTLTRRGRPPPRPTCPSRARPAAGRASRRRRAPARWWR